MTPVMFDCVDCVDIFVEASDQGSSKPLSFTELRRISVKLAHKAILARDAPRAKRILENSSLVLFSML